MFSGILGFLLRPKNKTKGNESNKKDAEVECADDWERTANVKPRSVSKRLFTESRKKFASSKKAHSAQEEKEPALVCYLCGQYFPRKSLVAHTTDCMKAWHHREDNKPIDEQVPVPSTPEELSSPLPVDETAIEQFNERMKSAWLNSINVRCEHCRKTFNASMYQKHKKTCMANRKEQEEEAHESAQSTQHVVKTDESQNKVVRKSKSSKPKRAAASVSSKIKAELRDISKTPKKKSRKPNKGAIATHTKSEVKALNKKEKTNKPIKAPELTRDSAPVKGSDPPKKTKLTRQFTRMEKKKKKPPATIESVGRSASFSLIEQRKQPQSSPEQKAPEPKTPVQLEPTKSVKVKSQKPSLSARSAKPVSTTQVKQGAEIKSRAQEQPAVEVKSRTLQKSKSEIKPKTEERPNPEIKTKVLKKSKSEKLPRAEIKPKTEELPRAEIKPKTEERPNPEIKTKVETKAKAEMKTKALEKSKSEKQPSAKTQTKAEERPNPEVKTKAETKTKAQEQTRPELMTKAEGQQSAEIKTRAPETPGAETKTKAQEQTRPELMTKAEGQQSAEIKTRAPETPGAETKTKAQEKPSAEIKTKTEKQPTVEAPKTPPVPTKGLKLKKSISLDERKSCRDDINKLKKSAKELTHSKSMQARRLPKPSREVDKESACNIPSSVTMGPPPQSPFVKTAAQRRRASTETRIPLSDRPMPTGPTRCLRKSASGDCSSFSKRNFGDNSFPERPKRATCRAPVAYHCYLCGRQFGSASLMIHVRQCRQLWEDREALKPKKQDRRIPPPSPKELDEPLPTDAAGIASFNDIMVDIWESKSLMSCPHCARTFTCEAFEKHQRVCTAQTPGGPHGLSKYRQVGTEITPNAGTCSDRVRGDTGYDLSSGPTQYYCYLCGRQYGNQSLMLHIPRCQKLWEQREAQKPREEGRALPELPPLMKDFPNIKLPTEAKEVLEFNNTIYEYWNRVSLYVCKICGRSFKEESFEKHQKFCTPENPGGALGVSKQYHVPLQESLSQDSKKENRQERRLQPRFLVCYLCGRQYGTESLMIHIPQCEKQWLADEAHKPEEFQRPLPIAPERIESRDLPKTTEEIAEFNQEMIAFYEEHTLIKCKTCNRTFNAEAYETHLRHCVQQHRRKYQRTCSNFL